METSTESPIEQPNPTKTRILHVDKVLSFYGSWAKLILTNPKGVTVEYALRFSFKVINNQAEYETLLTHLKLANHLEVEHLKVFTDS